MQEWQALNVWMIKSRKPEKTVKKPRLMSFFKEKRVI